MSLYTRSSIYVLHVIKVLIIMFTDCGCLVCLYWLNCSSGTISDLQQNVIFNESCYMARRIVPIEEKHNQM